MYIGTITTLCEQFPVNLLFSVSQYNSVQVAVAKTLKFGQEFFQHYSLSLRLSVYIKKFQEHRLAPIAAAKRPVAACVKMHEAYL